VDVTVTGLYPVVGFVLAVLNGLVLLPKRWLVSMMDLKEIGCEVGSWL
jgi:hypothetical protein